MFLIYDGECPFCSRYVRLLRIRAIDSEFRLVDARSASSEVDEARQRGYVIDEGMVLVIDGQYYHGDDCLHMLALLSTQQGWFNKFNYWLFRYQWLSKLSYPVLRAGRNAVLWILGKQKLGY